MTTIDLLILSMAINILLALLLLVVAGAKSEQTLASHEHIARQRRAMAKKRKTTI